MSVRNVESRSVHRLTLAFVTGVLLISGCIRDIPPEAVDDNPRPKIAAEPEKDKLAAAVQANKGDVVTGLQVVLGPLEPQKNHTTIDLNSEGKIEAIDLSGIAVTAAGLQHLTQIKETLQRLSLNDVFIDDAAVEVLMQLPHLRKLELNRTPVTDAGLSHIAKLTQLRELSLKGTEITNDGLVHLSALKELRMLSLSWTKISDDGLAAISELPELHTLMLNDTPITNAGLTTLRRLPKLQFLHITGTKVTPSGVAFFKREMPGVLVTGP